MFGLALRWVAVSFALALVLDGDAPERGRDLLRRIPSLDPQIVGHLVRDSPEEFRAYCRGIGPLRTSQALVWLNGNIGGETPAAYRRTMRELYPYVSQVADVMSADFDRPDYARTYQLRASLGDRGFVHRQWLLELARVRDGSASVAEKVERYRELARRFAAVGDERELMNIESSLARDVMRDGNLTARVRLLRSALTRARRLCDQLMVCQLLGELGAAYGLIGEPDSMVACYREGIARADRYVIPDQAARVRTFLAQHYLEEGRLAVGAALMQEALAVGRRHEGSLPDVRSVISATQYYAQLHCWDMVDRNTQRMPVILRALERANYGPEIRVHEFVARRLRAASLAAKGRPSEAADSLQRLADDARATARPDLLAPILRQHAEALVLAGRSREALAAAADGIMFAESLHFESTRRAFAVTLARAAIALHRTDAAEAALVQAKRATPGEPGAVSIPSYVLEGLAARIALERGDAVGAGRLLRQGLASLRDSIRLLDRGPHSDLAIQTAEDLWLVGHALLAIDARDDLEFERHWRSLVSWVGGDLDGPHAEGAWALRSEDPAPRTLQLVYAVMPEGLVRWTALPTGTRKEILALEPQECRRLVERVFALASSDPERSDAPMPADLVRLARRLGHDLLPEELRGGRYDRVSISAEGALGRLPFELLDVAGEGDYRPLLERVEVHYARCVRRRAHRATPVATLILADAPGGAARKNARESLPPLAAVESELARAGAELPNVRVIRGNETSKRALLQAWSRASTIYVASHLVREPDAPLFNYFPIAFEASASAPEENILDIRDVRDTDLRGCRLVVLSSCASGEPYVAGTRSGPSMADAFLDAGAQSVIHTRWRVRDESAAETAPRLASAWLGRHARGTTEWRKARLALVRGPHGIRHPFEWAAWSVTDAMPVPEWGTGTRFSAARLPSSRAPHAGPAASRLHGE